jgi:hypothetical protein
MFSLPSKEGIVYIKVNGSAGTEHFDKQYRKRLPQLTQTPPCVVEKTVKGIVWPLKKAGCKRYDACNCASGRAQNPSTDKGSKNIGGWSCKNGKKVIENSLPSRCNSLRTHTDLHVLMVISPKTSVGRYACAQFSSFLAA